MKLSHSVIRVAFAAWLGASQVGCIAQMDDPSAAFGEEGSADASVAEATDAGTLIANDTAALRWWRRRRTDAGTTTPTTDAGTTKPTTDAGTTTPTTDAGTTTPTTDAGTTTPPPATGSQWVVGYYAGYQRDMYPPERVDWSGMSHLALARLKTDGGGRLQTDFDIDNVNGPALARTLSTLAHQNGRKAILMLGGAGAGSYIRDSASAANRATFVANLLRVAKDLGYDGIDLDWEDDIDWDAFVALAAALRAQAPAGFILTAPVNPINPNISSPEPRLATLATHLDRLSVMSYHPATAFAGWGWLSWHNAPLTGFKPATPVTIADSLARFTALGIPKAKLSMGIGFYGICYTGGVTAPNQSTENGVTIQGGDNAMPLTWVYGTSGVFNSAYRFWDAAAQNTYLSLPSPDSHGCRYFSIEDAQSLKAKGDFSKANGYGGTVVWTINQGGIINRTGIASNMLTQGLKAAFLDP